MGVGNTTGSAEGTPPTADALFVGSDERGYFIRALGSVRAGLCYPLRDTILARLEQSSDVPAVWVDLAGCQYMDSTFIGLLVALDRRLKRNSTGRLHVVQPSARCLDLLRQMNLDTLLLIEPKTVALPDMEPLERAAGRPAAEFVLHVHEALMETSEEARRKFGLLREELQRKIRNEKNPEGTR